MALKKPFVGSNTKGGDPRSPYLTDHVPGGESLQVSADVSPSADKKSPDDETR